MTLAREGKGKTCFVMAPGAGGNFQSPFLVMMARKLAERDFSTLRFNFPYMDRKRNFPDPAPVLEECYREAADVAAGEYSNVVLGGKSMGGRIASQLVAHSAELKNVRGLIFLGYPLHAPGKQDKPRDAHLYDIKAPMLFVEGTRDAFANQALLQGVLDKLGKRAQVHWIEGADHSFKVKGRKPVDVEAEIVDVVAEFLGRIGKGR